MTTKREEWTITLGPNGWRFVDASGDTVADDVSDELKPRIAAVPDYEAALMEIREALATGMMDPDGAQEVVERALRKGGRIP